ncbi:DUF2254 family protein [Methylobacterium platani]|uniref:DUF2254 domain-containing protein n=2 Tax=Methylobacterium platani TaxID=427683 RepID=A0A179SG43_9HYPH|nr:DUF2254 family protein [Methylobacterium platani]KMO14117.1 hypothetical protein SQ03_20115 [Methylobacterium platani JCM 14648]OAS26847.1 hypothetical protein A5481_03815 [Methylobacterium platani]
MRERAGARMILHPVPGPQRRVSGVRRLASGLRRSFSEFLGLPVLIVAAFVVLAGAIDRLDNDAGPRSAWSPLRLFLSQYVGDTQSAISMLSTIAGSLISVTSITFSILLLAVQQGAATLNSQIVDHYLRRRANSAWFGFFVGVSLFVLITLVQTTHTTAPVFGVMSSTLLGAVSLVALVVLIYTTIDQTRPATAIATIREAALAARACQLPLLAASAEPVGAGPDGVPIPAATGGYLARIDAGGLARALDSHPGRTLALPVPVGRFVPPGSAVAVLTGPPADPALVAAIRACLAIEEQRDVAHDPAVGLDHIATIGWTAISTARSDPAVGAIAVHALQRLLHAWAAPAPRAATSRIVYRDRLPDQVLDAIESLIVAAAESRQHQSLALILRALALSLPVLPDRQQDGIARLVATVAPSLASHLPTRMLREDTGLLVAAFRRAGRDRSADHLSEILAHVVRESRDGVADPS